jgi:hypothetical protein
LVVVSATAESTATATITTATATKATSATAESTATACWTFFARTSFVNSDGATIKLFTIPELNSSLSCFLGVHFYETETAGSASHFVGYDTGFFYITGLGKGLSQTVLGGVVRQTTNIQLRCHFLAS